MLVAGQHVAVTQQRVTPFGDEVRVAGITVQLPRPFVVSDNPKRRHRRILLHDLGPKAENHSIGGPTCGTAAEG
ncbi:hypothetical protein GCM10023334_093970 [Nonomuraea thailandensis]